MSVRKENIIRWIAANAAPRAVLNGFYNLFSWQRKRRFWHYSKIFRGQDDYRIQDGCWEIRFAGKKVLFPLAARSMWLDWDLAVSFLGHDAEVKYAYERIIQSPLRPSLFFDVGANYGLDSIFFLVHGIRTLSFEPNLNCHSYIKRLCDLNGCSCEIQSIALADKEGTAELFFPENDTWLGTVDQKVSQEWKFDFVKRLSVKQMTLDQFAPNFEFQPELIKIDTEGSELKILQGSVATLQHRRPLVIFESWEGTDRLSIFSLFESVGYTICSLPLPPGERSNTLDISSFSVGRGTNFIACPTETVEQLQNAMNRTPK
jgi:FkbM family methyltransferase